MQSTNPYAPPQSPLREESALTAIDSLPVSDKWKIRFKAIELAGGPKLPNLKSIPKKDRANANSFNVLGFLFGPFYYLAKGMWKKAIVLCALTIIILTIIEIALEYFGHNTSSSALSVASGVIYAIRANIDYYKKMVLNDNGWW